LGVHTFDELIPTSLFKDHPEYFPLIGGKRVTGYVQRCLTNPEVADIASKNLAAWMDSDPVHHIFTLAQNDVEKYCECPECSKIMEEEGSPAGLYITFVNRVAEIVEKKHPENYVATLAYMFTEKPPKSVQPRKNVLVRLCPIYMCAGHPFTECVSPETKRFNEILSGWNKLTDRIFIWHYATDFSNYLMPFPNFRNFTEAIKTYAKSGVKGIFMQGAYTSPGSSDADLRAWVMARLLWNPEVDPDALVNEWMHAVYGPAYAPMRAIYDLAHSRVKSPGLHLRIFDAPTRELWPDDVIADMDKLFASAESLAAGDSTALYYVRKNRLAVRFVQLLHDSGQLEATGAVYKPAGSRVTAADYDRFMEDARTFGVTGLREEPFDCDLVTLIRQRFGEYPVVSLENSDLKLDVVPELGGRIVGVTLRAGGENLLGRTDALNYFYPAWGGYDESTTRTWRSTGFANPYTAERKGRSLILTGKGQNGLVFRRTITLPEKGTTISIASSITNSTASPIIARLVCRMELAADPAEATVWTPEKSGAAKAENLAEITEKGVEKSSGDPKAENRAGGWVMDNAAFKPESAAEFYRDGANKPSGVWRVENKTGGWLMENRFAPETIEACHLVADVRAKTVSMEILGFEKELAPGKGLHLENVWEIKKTVNGER
ncbi:MAG: DUF4838 domain-containing protein, partial [Candidatus Latescibacterota bacterium]